MPGKPKNVDLIKLDEVPKLLLEISGVTRVRASIYNWVCLYQYEHLSTCLEILYPEFLEVYLAPSLNSLYCKGLSP